MKSETAQSFLTFCKINFWTHWCYKESLPKLKLPFSVDVVNLMSKSSASVIVHDISKSHVQWTLFMVHLVNILMYESYREIAKWVSNIYNLHRVAKKNLKRKYCSSEILSMWNVSRVNFLHIWCLSTIWNLNVSRMVLRSAGNRLHVKAFLCLFFSAGPVS